MTDDETTGYHEVVVRKNANGERDVGYTPGSEPPDMRGPEDHGWGDALKTPAFEAVRDAVDLKAHDLGKHVATIHYDLEAWEYTLEFLVDADRDVLEGGDPDRR